MEIKSYKIITAKPTKKKLTYVHITDNTAPTNTNHSQIILNDKRHRKNYVLNALNNYSLHLPIY